MFRRVLIANRGEIARRVIRTCRRLGVETVAVHSDADRGAPHTEDADRAVHIGESPPARSYLDQDALIEAARASGADAVHPGYGFLAENAGFAARVQAEGFAWIGPPPDVIEVMGSKLASRGLAEQAGVPVLPATGALDPADPEAIEAAAALVGFPALVKLSAGGGGIGMTRVETLKKLHKAVAKAARRGESAFGDPTVYLERAVDRPRHVEVQVLCDDHGAALHLFERDCSVQRRHQKVIEEAPAPRLPQATREALWDAALRLARRVGYRNAGTVEFLVSPDGAFHFLEMNTRIQVEHPVTEAITGLDLVELQLRVASGEPLPINQEDVHASGHAIELRLYAEDPISFYPAPGHIELWREPQGPGIRVDHALRDGLEVTPFYDPLLAKVVAHGEDREAALARALDALTSLRLVGLTHNAPLHEELLRSELFRSGALHTGLISEVRSRGPS